MYGWTSIPNKLPRPSNSHSNSAIPSGRAKCVEAYANATDEAAKEILGELSLLAAMLYRIANPGCVWCGGLTKSDVVKVTPEWMPLDARWKFKSKYT